MAYKFIGTVKVGRGKWAHTAQHDTREDAARAAFDMNPNAKEVSTGEGYNGSFDIRWHRPDQIKDVKKDEGEQLAKGGTAHKRTDKPARKARAGACR